MATERSCYATTCRVTWYLNVFKYETRIKIITLSDVDRRKGQRATTFRGNFLRCESTCRTIVSRSVHRTYYRYIPVTREWNFLHTLLLKCHRTCPWVLAREEIRSPSISGREFRSIGAGTDFRAMYDVEISENTLNVKQNASLPVRRSLSVAASKP